MMAKRTMTLNLTDAEMRVLDDLSLRKDITKTADVQVVNASFNKKANYTHKVLLLPTNCTH